MGLRICVVGLVVFAPALNAQPPAAGETNPILCLEAGGPTAAVTAMAFSPDGRTLYVAGYDKVVHVYRRAAAGDEFRADPATTFRVPIGPGRDGVINTLAVSPDGKWLAVSGLGVYRGGSQFGEIAWINPDDAATPEMRRERFAIYLFDTATRAVSLLAGHEEDVLALAFAPGTSTLVSVGRKAGSERVRQSGRVIVWDLSNKTRLTEWAEPDVGAGRGGPPPGLAVRKTPDGVRVTVAWGDGKLRTRDGKPGGVATEVDAPPGARYTHTLAAAGGRLFAGGYQNDQGYMQLFGDGPGAGGVTPLFPLAVPWVVGIVADRAAVVLSSGAPKGVPGQQYRLALVDLPALSVAGAVDLGVRTSVPVIAASPDGRLVAVTADGNREVRVYPVANLLNQRGEAAALRSVGATIRGVAFANRGQAAEVGLVLRTPSGGGPDLVLDIGRRTLTADPAGQGWRWTAAADGTTPNDELARVRLRPGESITASARVPRAAPLNEPLLAVATWDAPIGEPRLAIYRARTGEVLRELNGHVGRVTSLSVSPDGRLLASAGDDQTVSVWGLTDLPAAARRLGTLYGITFARSGRPAAVAEVESGVPAAGVLAANDIIEAVTFGGPGAKPQAVASAQEFYEALQAARPREAVRITVQRGGAAREVTVPLEAKADERKPLVSLFVTRGRTPEWIAWSPLGPYDASGREAERYAGWHFNPPRPGEPVRFARADAYRERMHKPGLLAPLLKYANLTEALRELEKPVAVPRATLLCAVDGVGPVPQEGAGHVVLREPRVTFKLQVDGPSAERDEIESLTWRMDGGEPRPMPLTDLAGGALAQTLELKGRGVYRVQLGLRTREAVPQVVTRDLVLRYQPPPPRIAWDRPEPRLTVREPRFQLRAAVQPGTPGQKVNVLWRLGRKPPRPATLNIDESVDLEPGENVLEIQAANDEALAGFEEQETDRRAVVVVFEPRVAPKLELTAVRPLAPPGEPIVIEPGRPVTVAAGRVRVEGTIRSAAPLGVAALGEKSLTGFRPDTANEFTISEEVALRPDSQELVFRAQSPAGPAAEARLAVDYRPLLPGLTLTEPETGRTITEGRDQPEAVVKAALTPPDGVAPGDMQPFEVRIQVTNAGKLIGQAGAETLIVPFDKLAGGGLDATVKLGTGDNRIDVTIANRWRTAAAVERHVLYRRPPRFSKAPATSAPGEAPFTDVTAEVESASPLTRVECNGREYAVGETVTPAGASWRVTVPKVSLAPGPNSVRLRVSNADGPCLADGEVTVAYTPPKPKPPPVIEIVSPPAGPVGEPRYAVRYTVRSAGGPIRRVELRQSSQVLAAATDPPQRPDGPDAVTASGQLGPVPLREGVNEFRLSAINDGGESGETFTVSHVPVPEGLEIDRPASAVPRGEMTVTGRVNWSGAGREEEFRRKLRQFRVTVNGFVQDPPEWRSAGPNRLEFTARVILDRSRDNEIRADCAALRPEDGGCQRFAVDCERPAEVERTLHLLIVAVNAPRSEVADDLLARKALAALQATGRPQGGIQSPVFQKVVLYPERPGKPLNVLAGLVRREHVVDALQAIRHKSRRNDVALIYWRGEEAVGDDGKLYLRTSQSLAADQLRFGAVALESLLKPPDDVPGACAILLDTSSGGTAPATVAPTLPSTRAALMRYAWAQSATPVPGLLQALEKASKERDATSLRDLADSMARPATQVGAAPTLENNLESVPGLARTVLIRRP